jgi:hypothetical protein
MMPVDSSGAHADARGRAARGGVNHMCITMSREDVEALRKRFADNGGTYSDDHFVWERQSQP